MAQTGAAMTIDAERIHAFSRLMTDKLDNGDVNSRKAYIRSIVSAAEVDDHAIRIVGSPAVLSAATAGRQTANTNVRGFAREWRARKDSNL
jgi:site-specific DNA recombinase